MSDNGNRARRGLSGRALILVLFLGGLGFSGSYYFKSPEPVPSSSRPQVEQSVILPAPPQPTRPNIPLNRDMPAASVPKVVRDQQRPVNEGSISSREIKVISAHVKKIAVASRTVTEGEIAAPLPGPSSTAGSIDRYRLEIVVLLPKSNLRDVEKTIRKLGYDPEVTSMEREVKMTRLLIGTFPTAEAKAVLAELLSKVPDAFLLNQGAFSSIYAGSYHDHGQAREMADLLVAEEIKVEEETAMIKMAVQRVAFGDFTDIAEAQAVAGQARSVGLDVSLLKQP